MNTLSGVFLLDLCFGINSELIVEAFNQFDFIVSDVLKFLLTYFTFEVEKLLSVRLYLTKM